jgi:hypothetical protein
MIRKCFTLKTSDISLVQFIIEGYEGLATVSTIDSKVAVIQVLIMPDFVLEMESLLQDLQILFPMEEISSGSDRVE